MTENEAWGQAFENGRKVGDAEGYARGLKDAATEAGDLISREALITAIVNTSSKVAECHSGDVLTALADRQNEILDLVEGASAIDAEPVKHGRWEYEYGGKYANPRYRCSACKEKALYEFRQDGLGSWNAVQALTPSCPNCGARMDGDGDG